MTDAERVRVPNEIIDKIREHIQRTGRPWLVGPDNCDYVVEARTSSDGYQLSPPPDEWVPPFSTYREYAEYKGMTLKAVMDECNLERRSQLDDEISPDIAEQMVDPDDEPGSMPDALEDLPICEFEQDGAIVEMQLVASHDIGRPGFSQTGTYVESAFALSLLQYVLNARNAGVRIRLAN